MTYVLRHEPEIDESFVLSSGDGKWRLYQIVSNPIEDSKYDLSQKYPALLDKMIKMYDQYAQKAGVIAPDYSKVSFPGQVSALGANN
jgi:hypothetical protein